MDETLRKVNSRLLSFIFKERMVYMSVGLVLFMSKASFKVYNSTRKQSLRSEKAEN